MTGSPMRNIFAIAAILGSAQLAFAQNFGIDQPSPAEKLDVNGFIRTSQGYKFPDGTAQTTAVATANFFGYLANASSIISSNAGYAQFSASQNTDANVFEAISSGNFGIKIKKTGIIMWNYDQDIVAAGGSYVYIYALINGSAKAYSLIAPTGGYWDGMHIGGSYAVAANDVLTFYWASASTDITSMDNGVWGHLSIIWMGAK